MMMLMMVMMMMRIMMMITMMVTDGDYNFRAALKQKADQESIDVFEQNLYNLLLSPPVKGKVVLALDPGYTHGCKMAMLSPTGKTLHFWVLRFDACTRYHVNIVS